MIASFIDQLYAERRTLANGLQIAFCGRPKNAAVEHACAAEQSSAAVITACAEVGCRLGLLKQTHSNHISFDPWTDPRPEGDAIVCRTEELIGRPNAIGVVTADCLPIIISTERYVSVVHAGWRGLANGILQATLAQIHEQPQQIIIGPAAGPCCYEVGDDVVAALSDAHGVFLAASAKHEMGVQAATERVRRHLDLASTAQAQISSLLSSRWGRAFRSQTSIEIVSICTMEDLRFFSHRRDKPKTGRNLTVVWA